VDVPANMPQNQSIIPWYQSMTDNCQHMYHTASLSISETKAWYTRQVRNITELFPEPIKTLLIKTHNSLPFTIAFSSLPYYITLAALITISFLDFAGLCPLSESATKQIGAGIGITMGIEGISDLTQALATDHPIQLVFFSVIGVINLIVSGIVLDDINFFRLESD